MRFKLDENMPTPALDLLRRNGHDVHSVFDESLGGTPDETISDAVRREKRILLTLDLDFADVRVFPPGYHSGIIVLRPKIQSVFQVMAVLESILPLFLQEEIDGKLWIVGPTGVRIRG